EGASAVLAHLDAGRVAGPADPVDDPQQVAARLEAVEGQPRAQGQGLDAEARGAGVGVDDERVGAGAEVGGVVEEVVGPAAQVRVAPKGPRNSRTASGLGSHVSMCPGPPLIHTRMTRVSVRAAAPSAWSLSRSPRASPPTPRKPARRKLRRVRAPPPPPTTF